jgi:tRNA dimethylallyltransferase
MSGGVDDAVAEARGTDERPAPACAGGRGAVIGMFGPTGVGKTAVAIELARLLNTRVISCDSMQVYRGFPVLTNQPSAEELEAAPHVLVGRLDPAEVCTAAEYAALAHPLIEEDLAEAGWALVVGGTGLYMRAALAPLDVATGTDPDLRRRLEARAAAKGPDGLHAELAQLDPEAARSLDARNVRRVIRALEAISVTGRVWSGRDDLWAPNYTHPTMIVGLTIEREELYRRIDLRAAQIVDGGAVEEVRRFGEAQGSGREAGEGDSAPLGGSEDRPAADAGPGGLGPRPAGGGARPGAPGIRSAIGYPEIYRYLEGRQTRQETIDQIAAATRRYARRQLTWLRKVGDAVIIDVQDRDPRDIAREIAALAASTTADKEPRS